ncbi:ImmA/IrrE family metallo-endopeptidase [Lentilactobacillus buchneri]|uniref:ImmA/IrrE family metallo-endopeptidase n=1 Tax=Lentilactobacillus buchneri TaxID=1581 RepID=UPI0011EC8CEE|nr:ImmA/IrrE family metallo-endopeptidase [Lentilactobacillus buchneri]
MRKENNLGWLKRLSSGDTGNRHVNSSIIVFIKTVVERYQTADPFQIADGTNTEIDWVELGDHPLGKIIYYGQQPIIMLNNGIKDTPQQYFTLAHELGHLIVQPGLTAYQTGRYSHDVCEYQANQFATGLMGLLYVEENGYGPESYYDLVHHYGSPVKELD